MLPFSALDDVLNRCFLDTEFEGQPFVCLSTVTIRVLYGSVIPTLYYRNRSGSVFFHQDFNATLEHRVNVGAVTNHEPLFESESTRNHV